MIKQEIKHMILTASDPWPSDSWSDSWSVPLSDPQSDPWPARSTIRPLSDSQSDQGSDSCAMVGLSGIGEAPWTENWVAAMDSSGILL